jgi:hypothetical protein
MDKTPEPRTHDAGPTFIEPADVAPLTAAERATLQTAFAALVRSGRPLFAPPAPGEIPSPLDPADPGLDARVQAILDRPMDARDDNPGGPAI